MISPYINFPNPMNKLPFSLLVLGALAGFAQAQVTTAPVGFNSVTCKAGSDTFVSVPFSQQVYQGVISTAVAGGVSGQGVLTVQGTPSWTTSQYTNLYYVRMITGSKAGHFYTILNNDSGTLTIDLAGETVTGFSNTDSLKICAYWTLGTLLPAATQTTAVPSTGNLGFQRRTEILFPDLVTANTNLSPNRVFFVVNTTEWREATNSFANADNTIILPDTYFIVRHGNAAITTDTTFTAGGSVDTLTDNSTLAPLTTYIPYNASNAQDIAVTTGRPVAMTLASLNLVASGAFTPSTGNLGFQRQDELYVFDNTQSGTNKSAAHIYFYVSTPGEWREATNSFVNADNSTIPAGTGFIIRKHANASTGSVPWTVNN